jgi:hypothetical protein
MQAEKLNEGFLSLIKTEETALENNKSLTDDERKVYSDIINTHKEKLKKILAEGTKNEEANQYLTEIKEGTAIITKILSSDLGNPCSDAPTSLQRSYGLVKKNEYSV